MFDKVLEFFDRHQSFVLTTHDSPDADGIGAEFVLASVLRRKGKKVVIINPSPIPNVLAFIINPNLFALPLHGNHVKTSRPHMEIETWDSSDQKNEKYMELLENSALLILDTSDEAHLGSMANVINKAKESFIFDHHESKPTSKLTGFIDVTASSTSELAVELACFMGIDIDPSAATAVYSGLVFDTGFFSYPKTSERTFKAAIRAMEWGAIPNHIYKQLMENSSCEAILLQRQALDNLSFLADRKIALMFLRTEDFEIAGADFDDVENIVNIPLRAKEVEISILAREKTKKEIYCSLRSKGTVNVSKIAQDFGGGGHINAAGFRSTKDLDTILKKLLTSVESRLNL
jgi:phosphoesterase RecJ-like protein